MYESDPWHAESPAPNGLLSWAERGELITVDRRGTPLGHDHSVYVISEGAAEVFAIPEGSPGRWCFLGQAEAGAVLVPPLAGTGRVLLVRPAGETPAFLRLIDVAASGDMFPPLPADFDDGLTSGLDLLLDYPHRGVPPRQSSELNAGEDLYLEPGVHVRATGLLWVSVRQGTVRLNGDVGQSPIQGGIVALTGRDWLTAEDPVRLVARSTGQLVSAPDGWASLVAASTGLVRRLDRTLRALDERSVQRVRATNEADREMVARAGRALRATLHVTEHVSRSGMVAGTDPTLDACRVVADELGIDLTVPAAGGPAFRVQPIEALAIAARLRSRTVGLKDAWWKVDVGPLVGRRVTDGHPLALVFRRGAYHAHDPATGTRARVSERNSGDYEPSAVMFYRPLPDTPLNTWGLLAYGIRGSGRDLRRLVLALLASVGLGALVPLSSGLILGHLVLEAQGSLIVQICSALLVASAAAAVFGVLQNMALLRIEGRFESELQAAVWDRLLRLRVTFFRSFSTGELAAAALGVGKIRSALTDISPVLLTSTAVIVVNIVVLFFVSPWLGGLTVLLLALQGLFFLVLGTRQLRWQRMSLQVGYKLADQVYQTLKGLAKLRVANAVDRAFANWATTFARQKEIQKRAGRYQNAVMTFNAVYVPTCSMLAFILVAGGRFGTLTMADFLTFSAVLSVILTASAQLTNTILSVTTVVPVLDRLQPLLREPLEVSETSTAPPALKGDIEVSHVTFGYTAEAAPVVSDVSFRIRAGEMVAIVGPSGCGKSTLLRLLLGFEQPSAGSILYDGHDLGRLDQSAVRRQCGVVLQHARPFRGSIVQVITGGQDFTLDEAWQAADLAGVGDDIRAMPMTMHTLINDESTLSGGQRQRLVIANALIRRPRILFFDEATSALDNATQRIVTTSTQRLHATRVVIAHRLSTIMEADNVIVMDSGRIVQQGSPRQLAGDLGGLFHQLVKQQLPHHTQPVVA